MGYSSVLTREVERAELLVALFDHKGNRTAAGRQLGVNRTIVYRRMQRHGISRTSFPSDGHVGFSMGVEVWLARAVLKRVADYCADRKTLPFEVPADPRIYTESGQTYPLVAVPDSAPNAITESGA